MALILELRDRHASTSWHRLTGVAVTLGRAFSNDLIVDDPHADGIHVRIEVDPSGGCTVTDLGSMNGTFVDGLRVTGPQAVRPGMEVVFGRSKVWIHDADEPVPPAVAETAQRLPAVARWTLTGTGSAMVAATVVAVSALMGWTGSTNRSTASDTITAAFVGLLFIGVWAGIWGAVTRGRDRRFRFRAHLAVVASVFLALAVVNAMSEWLQFYFPGVWIIGAVAAAIFYAAIGGVVVAHLSVAGSLTPRGRLYAGLGVCAAIGGLAFLGTLGNDKFTDVPRYSAQLKPVPGGFVFATPVDDFAAAIRETKAKADEAAAKAASATRQ